MSTFELSYTGLYCVAFEASLYTTEQKRPNYNLVAFGHRTVPLPLTTSLSVSLGSRKSNFGRHEFPNTCSFAVDP